ncbi:MAG: heme exporter protein CcmD [Pseudomonadota bacterium]
MPDLGSYATEVGLAYAVSLALLGGIILLSVIRARRVARELDAAVGRRERRQE